MAGTVAVRTTNSSTLNAEWEIFFARFIPFPHFTTPSSSSSDLHPLPHRLRNRPPRGTWIASSTSAFLRFSPDLSLSDVILTVSFNGKLFEEHYVSKLNFSWPQVSCDPGFPARGIKTVLVNYRDSRGEIQKFAIRFPSIYEVQSFITALKVILKDDKGPQPLNIDFGSEISSQSEFMSTNKHSYRASEELSFVTPADTFIPQLPICMNNEREQPSVIQTKETASGHNFESILPALPPSFATFLMDCSGVNHTQSTTTKENDLKSQIARYMEDSSFQDMLIKVEKVIGEIGGDMSL
ncbi:protein POOR HOMOLOGOUS SYNAPSIS 1-like [Vicia villosa]|uniref:protein POOR HOMOLOGOUS SYNAPSIS 1-like n=1 Tax=Vicia villosa TaxID=3911 RepID=UPI00273A95F1|nr:protein POOR HOMOLOGOUS SYNAPSIS 1-like [Vicia villosa]